MSDHMAEHIVLMNMAAPLAAWIDWRSRRDALEAPTLLAPTVLQIAVLWAAHSPPLAAAAHGDALARAAVSAGLFVVAFWFWRSAFGQRGAQRWKAVLAFLATAKLYCLLGALLVFAPRALYAHAAHHAGAAALEDQQVAGLLMLAACGPSYVVAGVASAAVWLRDLGSSPARTWVR